MEKWKIKELIWKKFSSSDAKGNFCPGSHPCWDWEQEKHSRNETERFVWLLTLVCREKSFIKIFIICLYIFTSWGRFQFIPIVVYKFVALNLWWDNHQTTSFKFIHSHCQLIAVQFSFSNSQQILIYWIILIRNCYICMYLWEVGRAEPQIKSLTGCEVNLNCYVWASRVERENIPTWGCWFDFRMDEMRWVLNPTTSSKWIFPGYCVTLDN